MTAPTQRDRIVEVFIIIFVMIMLVTAFSAVNYYTEVKPNLYTIEFNDIDSIVKGSPVRFMGINIGHVRNLKRKNGKILCEIMVTKLETRIPDGSHAKVAFNGLAGSKSVEIMPPETNDSKVKGIVSSNSLRISDFMDTFKYLGEAMAVIKDFVESVDVKETSKVLKGLPTADDVDHVNVKLDEINNNRYRFDDSTKTLEKAGSRVDAWIVKFKK